MTKAGTTQAFTALTEDLWIAQTQVGVFPCYCLAVQGPNAWTIYGAGVNLAQRFLDQFQSSGKVAELILPNSFHYLGVAEWRALFPEASLVSGVRARDRLASKGVADIRESSNESRALPETYELIELPESKIGELWLSFEHTPGQRGLAVGDAFFCMAKRPGLQAKLMNHLAGITHNPSVSRLFKYSTLLDKKRYRDWARMQIERIEPTLFVPQHGEVLRGSEVAAQLVTALERRMGA